jgi:hypothetical protein
VIDQFRFNLNLWRKAFVPEPFTPPPDARISMVIDPSYTSAKASSERRKPSDCSGLLVGFKYDRENGGMDLHVLDGSCDRFKGLALAEEAVRLIALWNPARIRIEKHGTGAYDILHDSIMLFAKMKELTIRDIAPFTPNNRQRAKPLRIRRIQTDLLECDPPALQIHCKSISDALLDQAEKFVFESNSNKEREDALLDCIALMAFRGDI